MYVTEVTFSPDGETLASGSYDEHNQVMGRCDKEKISPPLRGHTGNGSTSVTFSPDGKTLASGSGDETIKLWDVATRHAYRHP